jgi:cysteinyl-tRNA synthetase
MFPHHECEIAQTEAHTGKPFVGIWLHARHLLVDGTKMSKSLGNFFTVEDVLRQGYSGHELRYALVRVQYRQALNFTLKGLDEARAAIARVQQCRQRLVRLRDGLDRAGGDDLAAAVAAADAAFTAAMSEDLNVSEALAAVFDFVGVANKAAASVAGATAALALFARCEDVLGCFGGEPKADVTSEAPAELVELLRQRREAGQGLGDRGPVARRDRRQGVAHRRCGGWGALGARVGWGSAGCLADGSFGMALTRR